MLRTKNLKQYNFDDVDPWGEIITSVAWAIHSTHHTTLQTSLIQLVFGRDMLFDMKLIVDWETIMLKKQKDINKNIRKEIAYVYPMITKQVTKYLSLIRTFIRN